MGWSSKWCLWIFNHDKSPFNSEKKTIMIFITFYCSICFQDFLVKMRFILKLLQWQCVALSTFRESKELSGSPTIPSFFLVPWAFFERHERNEAVMWSTWNLIGVGLQGFGKWGFQWAFETKISSNTLLNSAKLDSDYDHDFLWGYYIILSFSHIEFQGKWIQYWTPPKTPQREPERKAHIREGKTNLWCLTVQVFRVCLLWTSWNPKANHL